ncbi:hypothetical protein [Streptomyces sp. CB01201]|uniref:hypothetical protein n=1 Tax=Streptomyces sp. CB01201 TaxID=2020324 RepID=UPI00131D0355|nr:hypothetical protein [Streptomyces sp. CB01201]
MTKNHARKEEVRRRMKENGRNSYQAELKTMAAEAGDAKSGDSGPQQRNADRREEFVLAVLDADLPQMVKVLLHELASRLDLSLSDWHENNTRVRFEEEELARCVGLDEEAANLCRDLAVEANWLVEIEEGVVDLRTPHEDWDLYFGALSGLQEPIEDEDTYRSKLDAFVADIEQIARTPMISGHALKKAMVKVIGHTFEPLCIGGELSQKSHGLGSGEVRTKLRMLTSAK